MRKPNYCRSIREYCTYKVFDKPSETKITEYFPSPIKVGALTLPLRKFVYYKKPQNMVLYFEDDFGNTITINKLTESECKVIYDTIMTSKNPNVMIIEQL